MHLAARVLVSCAVAAVADCCGMTTHDFIAHRAREYYYQDAFNGKYEAIVQSNLPALQGGAPFPDYLYTCGSDHDAGEEAHWSPFQAAAVNYIATLPKPWTNSTEALVAFFFGVVSHYIADINWHGLAETPSGYGLIETLGMFDFNCTGDLCSVAHTAADTGGEFVASYQTNLTFAHPSTWYIPTTDLINIYKLRNYTVTAASLDECHLLFYAGETAIKYLGWIVFHLETDNAPFLVEHYLDLPLGGIDDNAVWTGRMWNRFAAWIEYGVPPGPPPLEESRAFAHRHERRERYSAFANALNADIVDMFEAVPTLSGATTLQLKAGVSPKALIVKILAALKSNSALLAATSQLLTFSSVEELEVVVAAMDDNLKVMAATKAEATGPAASGTWAGEDTVGYLGSSLASGDFNGDGYADVALGSWGNSPVGMPQAGKVSVQLGPVKPTNGVFPAPPVTLSHASMDATYARFGYATAALDFNDDGVDDLVVASPTYGWNWTDTAVSPDFIYRGRVEVYLGAKVPVTSNPFTTQPIIIDAVNILTNFGTVLSVGDVNGDGKPDLIIGSPLSRGNPSAGSAAIQRGAVNIFYASSTRSAGSQMTDAQADITLYGGDQFAWFGASIATSVWRGQSVLLVGAPGYRSNAGTTTVGRLNGYVTSSLSSGTPAPQFTITGSASMQQGKLGWSVAAASHASANATATTLAFSIPTAADKQGIVVLVPIDAIPAGDTAYEAVAGLSSTVTTLTASNAGSRFGWRLAFANLTGTATNSLVVSAPFESEGWALSSSQHNNGAVYVYNLPLTSGSINSAEQSASWSVIGAQQGGRTGTVVLPSHLAVPGTSKGCQLLVATPYADTAAGVPMGGSVAMYAQ